MIKDLTFGGIYNDERLRIETILVTPAKHGYADDTLLFEVCISTHGADRPQLREYTFYIMDGQSRIYNATDVTELSADELWTITVLVAYPFRTEYLYHDIQLGFRYEPYNCVEFVEIGH